VRGGGVERELCCLMDVTGGKSQRVDYVGSMCYIRSIGIEIREEIMSDHTTVDRVLSRDLVPGSEATLSELSQAVDVILDVIYTAPLELPRQRSEAREFLYAVQDLQAQALLLELRKYSLRKRG
jgi:hypothetical protein